MRRYWGCKEDFKHFPLKYLNEFECFICHILNSVVLNNYHLIQKLALILVLDDMFEPLQRVAIPRNLNNCYLC